MLKLEQNGGHFLPVRKKVVRRRLALSAELALYLPLTRIILTSALADCLLLAWPGRIPLFFPLTVERNNDLCLADII